MRSSVRRGPETPRASRSSRGSTRVGERTSTNPMTYSAARRVAVLDPSVDSQYGFSGAILPTMNAPARGFSAAANDPAVSFGNIGKGFFVVRGQLEEVRWLLSPADVRQLVLDGAHGNWRASQRAADRFGRRPASAPARPSHSLTLGSFMRRSSAVRPARFASPVESFRDLPRHESSVEELSRRTIRRRHRRD